MGTLDSNFPKAMAKWAQLIEAPKDLSIMEDVMDRYMLKVAPMKAPGTYKNNVAEMANLKKVFGEMSTGDIETPDIYRNLDIRGKKAPISANREIALFSHVFKMAVKWGVVKRNPCQDVEKNKENKRDKYLTDYEYLKIKNAATPLVSSVMDIAYRTGLRKIDIPKIRLSDITEEGLHVTPSKTSDSTKKKLVFKMTPDLGVAISKAKSINRAVKGLYLFSNRKGQPYTTSGFDSLWKRVIIFNIVSM